MYDEVTNWCEVYDSFALQYRSAIYPTGQLQHFLPEMFKRTSRWRRRKRIQNRTFSHNSIAFNSVGGTPPQFKMRDKSFPVPIGIIATSGNGLMFFRTSSFRIQPTVPSPPATSIRHCTDRILLIKRMASSGPDLLSSKIWIGFSTLRIKKNFEQKIINLLEQMFTPPERCHHTSSCTVAGF